jgi:hypothetical protein
LPAESLDGDGGRGGKQQHAEELPAAGRRPQASRIRNKKRAAVQTTTDDLEEAPASA